MRSITVTSMLIAVSLALSVSSNALANSVKTEKDGKRTLSERLNSLKKKLTSQPSQQETIVFPGPGTIDIFGKTFVQSPLTQEEIDEANEEDGGE